eukprot:3548240-Alexandrium_andersonii.AAC.1
MRRGAVGVPLRALVRQAMPGGRVRVWRAGPAPRAPDGVRAQPGCAVGKRRLAGAKVGRGGARRGS